MSPRPDELVTPPSSRELTEEELEDLIDDEGLIVNDPSLDTLSHAPVVLVQLSPEQEDAVKPDDSKPTLRVTTSFHRPLRG
jgi:hypothetical protein